MASSPGASPSPKALIEPVLQEHVELDCLFLDHQVALMSLDIPGALLAMQRFENLLERHMQFEEELLIPFWRDEGGDTHRLGPDLLENEHLKLLSRLDGLRESLAGLRSEAALSHRDIIELLDEELRFKRLLHHHDERERLGLYTFLKERLPDDDLESLATRVAEYLT